MDLERKVAGFIAAEGLLPDRDRPVVVGLSGGADSVALLSVLRALGFACVAVHCHFGLRGDEADRDMAHAESVARSLGARFRSVRFDTRSYMREHGVSAEMACRDLRYGHFREVVAESGAQAVAVAHHRDDNIETLMLNLLRGSGIHGLRGMLPAHDGVVRPMLECTRDEILEYLRSKGLDYVTDSTNAENDFSRNRLRNVVLPVLYREFPGAGDAIGRTLSHLRGNETLYNSLLPTAIDLPAIKRSAAPATLIHELLSPMGFNSSQTEAMLSASSGATFVSATHRADISRGELEVSLLSENDDRPPRLTCRHIAPGNFSPREGVLYLDAAALDGCPCWELRHAAPGDRIRPFGMKGSRLMSDVFASARLSAPQKRRQWVLVRDGVILWAVGLRASAHFPVTSATTEILEIEAL